MPGRGGGGSDKRRRGNGSYPIGAPRVGRHLRITTSGGEAYFGLAMERWLWCRLQAFPTRLLYAHFPPKCDVQRRHPQCPLHVDCVEKLHLISVRCGDSFSWGAEIRPMRGYGRVMQEALFYGFSLERHVPDNHLLRRIDRFVDLSEV